MNFLALEGLSTVAQAVAIGAALAAVAVLVAMYFLKLKRLRREVSSTFLWRRSVQDLHANSPFQRLRRNLLLFLQVLILTASLVALGRPALMPSAAGGANYVVLIDTSASMQARDVPGGRLAAALSRVNAVVDDMNSDDSMMIMTFGLHPKVVATSTNDKRTLRAALSSIVAGDTSTNAREVLELADSLAENMTSPRILLVSDGAFGDEPAREVKNARLEFVRVGRGGSNVGITAVDVRRSIEDPETGEVFVAIGNFTTNAVNAEVSLAIDGRLAEASKVQIESGGSQAAVFKVKLDSEKVAEVSLDVDDDLAADNRACLVLLPPAFVPVVVVGEANPFLLGALEAEDRFEVTRSDGALAADERFPVFVFDGSAPETLQRAGYLIFNAVPPGTGFSDEGELDRPVIIDVDMGHPATAFLDLGDVFISKARRMGFPQETKVLVDSDQGPLVALSYAGAAKVITVAFDPMDSRWPLRISFPMFVANAVNFLAGGGAQATARQFVPGEPLVIDCDPAVDAIAVTGPDGKTVTLRATGEGTVAFGETLAAGVYAVDAGARRTFYAANLGSVSESDITPAQEFRAGSSRVEPKAAASMKNKEIWRELLAFAFVVLVFEWYIYNRRVYL